VKVGCIYTDERWDGGYPDRLYLTPNRTHAPAEAGFNGPNINNTRQGIICRIKEGTPDFRTLSSHFRTLPLMTTI
jgi:hypothetical protein